MQDEQVRQRVDDIPGIELAINFDHQRLSGKLVDDVECAVDTPLMGAALHEVIRPHMVRALWPEPNARSVIEPEPAALRLSRGNFQPFAPPDTLNPLVVHRPARAAQQRHDPAVTVATVRVGTRLGTVMNKL